MTTILAQKLWASVFWDPKGIILIEFFPQGETISAARYYETLKKLRRVILNMHHFPEDAYEWEKFSTDE